MEDSHHVSLSLQGHRDLAYIGVFDGHNGSAAAEWMAKQMPIRLNDLPNPTDHAQLAQSVEKADADFMSDASVRVHGATACLALISSANPNARRLTVANVGDSRVLVIAADGTVRFATIDHKPDTESEAQRILLAGGTVSMGRVDGDLAMSRSIGDWAYKNVPHLSLLEQKVIATPDCSDIDLAPTDIVLICCDGLFERLSNEQVALFLVERLAAQRATGGEVDPALLMVELIDYSLLKGSKDNMSAALLLPMDGTTYARADEYRLGPFVQTNPSFVDAFFADAKRHGYSEEQIRDIMNKQKDDGAGGKQNNSDDAILVGKASA